MATLLDLQDEAGAGLSSVASKLRRVRFARERSASIDTPSISHAQLIAFGYGDLTKDASGSAMACLDEAVEHLTGLPGHATRHALHRRIFQCRGTAGRMEKRGGVQDDDVISAWAPRPARSARSRAAFSCAPPPVTTFRGARWRPASSGVNSSSVIAPFDRRSARVSPWSATSSRPDPWTTSASSTPWRQASGQSAEASSDPQRRAAVPAASPDSRTDQAGSSRCGPTAVVSLAPHASCPDDRPARTGSRSRSDRAASRAVAAGTSIRAPNASRTSAEPQRELTLRLPCFAIGKPAAAATKAVAVETLIRPDPSPPVPQQSAKR